MQVYKTESSGNIEIPIFGVEVIHGDGNSDETFGIAYGLKAFWTKKSLGCLIALPFFSFLNEERPFVGYLIYHDADAKSITKERLISLYNSAMDSPSGQAGSLSPLPYKPMSWDEIDQAIDKIIANNTKVDLSGSILL